MLKVGVENIDIEWHLTLFYVQRDTKTIVSETFFTANLLA